METETIGQPALRPPKAATSHRPRAVKKQRAAWSPDWTVWFVLDAAFAYLSMWLSFLFSPYAWTAFQHLPARHIHPGEAALSFALAVAVSAHIFALHDPLLPRQWWSVVTRCVGATGLAIALLAFYVFTVIYGRIGRYIMLEAMVFTPVLMAFSRRLVWTATEQRRRRLLLLGASRVGEAIRSLIRMSGLPIEVVGSMGLQNPAPEPQTIDASHEAKGWHLGDFCGELNIDEVVTCCDADLGSRKTKELMECLNLGIRVSNFSTFIEKTFYQVPVEDIRGEWFLQADLEFSHPIYHAFKRGIDIGAGLVGLMLSLPIIALAAVAIKLESRGPVFYSQVRSGQFNRPFRIWKLRTMRSDAESNGPQWAAVNDRRVTWVGKILRVSRIDETPQFFNILSGEMSLVGPRPERPKFVADLSKQIPFYEQRHLVKPGLTGWAQINYPYGSTVKDATNKLKYDLYYVKHASLGLDLQIILRTLGAAMKGAR